VSQTKAELIKGLNINASAPATALQIDASGNVNIDSNTLYVDATNNRVGLGTSSPGYPLDIQADSSAWGLNIRGRSSDNQLFVRFADNVNTSSNALIGVPAANTLSFWTGASERARIDSSGRLGIGTTSPGAPLSVNGNAIIGPESGTRLAVNLTENDKVELQVVDSTSTARALAFTVGANEAMRLDASSRLLVGTSTARSNIAGITPQSQIEGTSFSTSSFSLTLNSNDSQSPYLEFAKTRATSIGGVTVVQNNDQLGYIGFAGADGNDVNQNAAAIAAYVDGTPGANDMPGRLVFSTTADGASSPTERMRITSGGIHRVTQSGNYNETVNLPGHYFQNDNNTANGFIAWNNSFTASVVQANCLRSANSAYTFYYAASGNGSTAYGDTEFNLRGDGTGLCDGSWTGGGADYAEYFEWSDGNPDEDDRRGVSVVLDGEKIRPAVDGEDPIGVISGNPSVVGDAAWNKWNGKYLRDDFGTYIQEDYEVEDEDGNTVIQQRRKLNPSYDPDQEYINREERPEWDCVGLMGKLRIRKGQPTGSRWIKMRDISDSVEEWLVR
jgi:hypothetical protein